MFSLAITTYTLAVGEHPFIEDGRLSYEKQKEADWAFLETKKKMSPELRHFLVQIGHQHKNSRLAASTALLHPFIVQRKLLEEENESLEAYYQISKHKIKSNEIIIRQTMKLLL
jgi:hypothetical protein